jgi:hypothetical protein
MLQRRPKVLSRVRWVPLAVVLIAVAMRLRLSW